MWSSLLLALAAGAALGGCASSQPAAPIVQSQALGDGTFALSAQAASRDGLPELLDAKASEICGGRYTLQREPEEYAVICADCHGYTPVRQAMRYTISCVEASA